MAGAPDHPLTVAEAKERLRRAGAEAGLAGLVRRRPYASLLLAAAAGAFFGSSPTARDAATRETLRLLARTL